MSGGQLGIEITRRGRAVGRSFAPPHLHERSVSVGARGDVVVREEGVLPVHLFLFAEGGRLFAASASRAAPARTRHTALPTRWVEVTMPCRLHVGAACLDLFWCAPAGASDGQGTGEALLDAAVAEARRLGGRAARDWQRASLVLKLALATLLLAASALAATPAP